MLLQTEKTMILMIQALWFQAKQRKKSNFKEVKIATIVMLLITLILAPKQTILINLEEAINKILQEKIIQSLGNRKTFNS